MKVTTSELARIGLGLSVHLVLVGGLLIAPAAEASWRGVAPATVVAAVTPTPTPTPTPTVTPTPTPTPTRTRTPSPTPTPTATPTATTPAAPTTPSTGYSLIQVSGHSTSADCWSAVNGLVYNLTGWIGKHPGGPTVIVGMCGGDGSGSYNGQHSGSSKARNALTPYLIGTYTGGPAPTAPAPSTAPGVSYTATQVSAHNKTSDCWVIISGYVYDLTVWKGTHSGTSAVIDPLCGKDGSATFTGKHSGTATAKLNILAKYAIGSLSGSATPTTPAVTPTTPYTFTQVATHSKTTDCWVVVNGSVYDLTVWKGTHSGTAAVIDPLCGKDGSATFTGKHGAGTAKLAILATFMKGIVSGSAPTTTPTGTYTIAQVALHNKTTDCWVAITGNVYNLTVWKGTHSGGSQIIDGVCGTDGTLTFYGKHSSVASSKLAILSAYLVGIQSGYVPVALPAPVSVDALSGNGEYTLDDVAQHSTPGDCWSAIGGGVYGLSTWIPVHPGGAGVVTAMCGNDGTAAYGGKHGGSASAGGILSKLRIGTLVATKAPALIAYTLADVAAHKTATDCWSVVNGAVVNLTKWIAQHPGGPDVITAMCGTDGTAAYNSKHGSSNGAKTALDSFVIGTLTGGAGGTSAATATTVGLVRSFSMRQVHQHASPANCWTVVSGKVYNVTAWTKKHANQKRVVRSLCGRNATRAYIRTHGGAAKSARLLKRFLIGSVGSSPTTPAGSTYTTEQVASHGSAASCWSIVSGGVYDLTTWVGQHPGGSGVIKAMCGRDGTSSFQGMHSGSVSAKAALVKLMIGVVG